MPAWATTWAMPLPMVPAPTTSTRPIEWGSNVDAVSLDSRTVYSSSFADAFALDCTSPGE